jgi:hypothetical protein
MQKNETVKPNGTYYTYILHKKLQAAAPESYCIHL